MIDPKKELSDIEDPKKAFWFHNGVIAMNLTDLANNIEALPREVFAYHANSEKNDFYRWVVDVIGDVTLARQIKNQLDQKAMVSEIRRRIHHLEKSYDLHHAQ